MEILVIKLTGHPLLSRQSLMSVYDFTLKTLQNATLDMKSLQGKVILIVNTVRTIYPGQQVRLCHAAVGL